MPQAGGAKITWPAVAGVTVVAVCRGRPGLRDLGHRQIAWRGRTGAWSFAVGVPPLPLVVAATLTAVLDGRSVADLDWAAFGSSEEFAALPAAVFWLANLVFFGFGEEIGWRGFLQPHLERRHPPGGAASLVAVLWSAWHLPLFAITPSYRAMPAIGYVGFAASIWVASFVFAWLLRASRGSVLICAVFHSWFDVVTTSPLGPELLPTAVGAAVKVVGLVLLRRLLVDTTTTPSHGHPCTGERESAGKAPRPW